MTGDSSVSQATHVSRPATTGVDRAAVGIFLFLLGLYLLTHGGDVYVSDGYVMYKTTDSLVQRHSFVVQPSPELSQIVPGKDGYYFSKYGLGQPVLATIPYAIAGLMHPWFGSGMPAAELELYAVTLFNQFVTAFTGVLLYVLALRLGNSVRVAIALALAWGIGTLAWPYSKMFFSEPLFTCCVVLAALGLLAYAQTLGPRRFWWLVVAGGGLGYSILVRVSGVLLFPPFFAYAIWLTQRHPEGFLVRSAVGRLRRHLSSSAVRDDPSRAWRSLLAACAAFGIPLGICALALMWHNLIRFGDPFNNGYGNESFNQPLREGVPGLLVSPGKGLFVYSPITILSVIGWRRFWKSERATALLFAVIPAILLVQSAKWWSWWGGWCWGPRLLVPVLPFMTLTLGPLISTSVRARIAAWILSAIGAAFALLGVLIDFNPYIISVYLRHDADITAPVEPEIYYHVSSSPLVHHARMLFNGFDISVVTFDLPSLGFTRFEAALMLTVLAVVLISGIAILAGVLRSSAAVPSTSTAAPAHVP